MTYAGIKNDIFDRKEVSVRVYDVMNLKNIFLTIIEIVHRPFISEKSHDRNVVSTHQQIDWSPKRRFTWITKKTVILHNWHMLDFLCIIKAVSV